MDEKKIEAIRAKKFPLGALDIVVFAAAIALTVALFCTVFGEKGSGVEIVGADMRIVLPLGENATRKISDCLTVEIRDGSVRVIESTCKNKTCVKMGKIGRVGESIVCAQNGIVITVLGGGDLVGSVGKG